ncbi:MAG: amidase family protein [Granulosicoccus sp.]|nr:amidase family protein [Granulosicoccus sp.]
MQDIWRLSAADTAKGLVNKDFSATEVAAQSLDRLDKVNPKINAVINSLPDEAMAAAEKVDACIANGKDPGPLAGVPVTIKVNVDQQGHATTNGLRLLENNIAQSDSPLVANLRNAGAIIIGRTNTPAFSMRWFTRNQLHGHTLNPRNTSITPGGSSGGGAAATAAGIGAIAHGTDIAGSVRYPAYACGLQGLRPTHGRIPALNASLPDRHICPQLTAVSGPMARSVEDVRLGYEAMSQPSILDPWWVNVPRDSGDFEKVAALCTHPDGLETCAEVTDALKDSAKKLEEAGWKIVETDCPAMREPMQHQIQFWMSEYALDQGQGIHAENDPDANFVSEQLMSIYEPTTLSSLMALMQERVGLVRQWQQFLQQYPILICPPSAELPFKDQLDVESAKSFRHVLEAQMTQIGIPFIGVPAMTITTGTVDNVPVGVQLVADKFREDVLFSAGKEIEKRSATIEIAEP